MVSDRIIPVTPEFFKTGTGDRTLPVVDAAKVTPNYVKSI
jgi:hypothetical protein